MTGPKLNEGVLLLDDGQVTTKATARYLRGSASKARAVLDLIRGLDVRRADEVLQFTERAASQEVRKVLASAVANAVHNDNQDAEELFVVACFADEGPTLKRFKPRARGRASRILKRTCHITVIVARMSDARLEVVQARQAASTTTRRPGTSAQSRRDRVARSRARAESLREGTATEEGEIEGFAEVDGGDVAEAAAEADTAAEGEGEGAEEAPEVEADGSADLPEGAGDEDSASVSRETTESVTSGDTETETAQPAAELPAGAVEAPEDGSIPDGYAIKGNASSKKFHIPGGRYYDITVAELFFDSVESAEAAGYEAPAADASKIEEDNQ